MTFAWPHAFWLLVVPLALLARELSRRRRTAATTHPKILRAEAGPSSLVFSPRPSPSTLASRSATPRVRPWLCAGLCLAVLALARPQWGRLEEPVFDQSREILLAIDLSRSMLAPDVKPSRLDRAKLLIQSLLEKLQGERIGLVVFAGTAFLQSPLSSDYEILREFLPALGPDFLPQGGSNYTALLDASIQAFSATNSADRFLVVLSDGEATDDDWRARLAELKNKNVRVLALGVGTAEGAMLPDGSGGLIKDERGAVVLSKLESNTLQELARETSGVYRDASTWIDLAALVNETVEAGRKGQFVEKNTVRLVERYQWPLAFAVWCFLVSLCYEFPVRPRVRDLKLAAPLPPNAPPVNKPAAATPTTVALLLLALVASYPVSTHAAATRATPPHPPTQNSKTQTQNPLPASPAAPAEESPLAKIVARLSGAATPSGRDWAELARETVTWGSRLQSSQQPVPEGPVRDALAAVDLGSKLDAKTADWPKLRSELEALLEKKDEQQQDQQNQDQQNQQDQDQQQQQQKKDDQQKQKNKQDSSKQQQQQNQQEPQNSEQKDSGEPPQPEQNKQPQGESAFGDMNKKEEPPPPPPSEENMQQVGGAEQPPPQQAPDPSLALPLQKLDQLRNQDSPAQLFQLMEGDKKPTKKPTKDW